MLTFFVTSRPLAVSAYAVSDASIDIQPDAGFLGFNPLAINDILSTPMPFGFQLGVASVVKTLSSLMCLWSSLRDRCVLVIFSVLPMFIKPTAYVSMYIHNLCIYICQALRSIKFDKSRNASMSTKTPFSIRFDEQLLNNVRRVSFLEGISMTEIIEQAVQNYIDNIKQDRGEITDG